MNTAAEFSQQTKEEFQKSLEARLTELDAEIVKLREKGRDLKDQAKDLLKAGAAASVTDAQFKIARQYGFASWPKLKAHIDSMEEIGQLKQAIDTNDVDRVKSCGFHSRTVHR